MKFWKKIQYFEYSNIVNIYSGSGPGFNKIGSVGKICLLTFKNHVNIQSLKCFLELPIKVWVHIRTHEPKSIRDCLIVLCHKDSHTHFFTNKCFIPNLAEAPDEGTASSGSEWTPRFNIRGRCFSLPIIPKKWHLPFRPNTFDGVLVLDINIYVYSYIILEY